jgi:transcriptional regulator with XRE-family HTH domain
MPTLRELRVKRNWRQKDLAGAAGLGHQTVWRAESGLAINEGTAQALCLALNVSLEEVAGIKLYSAVQVRNRRALQ